MGEKQGKGRAGSRNGALRGSGSSSKPLSNSKLVLFLQTGALTVALVLGMLALGLIVTPPLLRLWQEQYGEAEDVAARMAAVAGLEIETGEIPPINHLFKLSEEATPQQRAFLRYYGFVHFANALSSREVQSMVLERRRIEKDLVASGNTSVYGVPLFRGACADNSGRDGALDCIHRIPFCSLASTTIRRIVHDSRFHSVKELFADDAFSSASGAEQVRVGDREKDGVVMNTYVNKGERASSQGPIWSRKQLGWHTDALRDIAYGRMPGAMLNFGIHLDDCDPAAGDAALCLLPGTHRQSFFGFLFRKIYFLSEDPDEDEICVQTSAGDVTIHDGRLWHRVKPSERPSLRRSVYVPILTVDQPVEIKTVASSTPFYHYFGMTSVLIRRKDNTFLNFFESPLESTSLNLLLFSIFHFRFTRCRIQSTDCVG